MSTFEVAPASRKVIITELVKLMKVRIRAMLIPNVLIDYIIQTKKWNLIKVQMSGI